MSKRFFYKVYTSGEVDFFDNEQEYVNEKYTCDDVRGLHPMDYWELVELLNEQQAIIKSKDKQLERLYNYFQDYLKDEMSGNAFSEMWDFVKEDESWEDETIYC